MSGPVFTIEVGEKRVRGRIDPDGGTTSWEELSYTTVQLDTVTLLENWLKRWEWIAGLEQRSARDPSGPAVRRSVLVPDTFRVLGSQMWELLLPGEVGRRLITEYDAVVAKHGTLQVLISFENEAATEKLAGLPWEFLHYPGTPDRRGFFLGTHARLVLGRYLQRSTRPELHDASRLRVVFWVTLPVSDDFKAERDECERTRTALGAKFGEVLDAPDPICGWKPWEVAEHLNSKADIVHVVGVARPNRRGGSAVEMLVTRDGQDTWIDSDELVEALTGNPQNRPELVVLHLCGWMGSDDASENFERLAPMLVRADVPAVLAMQYPMTPGDADGFITEFYDRLIELGDIGTAVQKVRSKMKKDGESRRFGVPVLYMQSKDGRLFRERPTSRQGAGDIPDTAPVQADTSAPGQQLRGTLRGIALQESPDAACAVALRDWIESITWPDDRSRAWTIIRNRARDEVHDDRLRPVYGKLLDAALGGGQ